MLQAVGEDTLRDLRARAAGRRANRVYLRSNISQITDIPPSTPESPLNKSCVTSQQCGMAGASMVAADCSVADHRQNHHLKPLQVNEISICELPNDFQGDDKKEEDFIVTNTFTPLPEKSILASIDESNPGTGVNSIHPYPETPAQLQSMQEAKRRASLENSKVSPSKSIKSLKGVSPGKGCSAVTPNNIFKMKEAVRQVITQSKQEMLKSRSQSFADLSSINQQHNIKETLKEQFPSGVDYGLLDKMGPAKEGEEFTQVIKPFAVYLANKGQHEPTDLRAHRSSKFLLRSTSKELVSHFQKNPIFDLERIDFWKSFAGGKTYPILLGVMLLLQVSDIAIAYFSTQD